MLSSDMELSAIVQRLINAMDLPITEVAMSHESELKIEKIQHPQNYYETPDELINDQNLSWEEKKTSLEVWEQDARQMLAASNEGMPGNDEGISQTNHHQLGQVERAKNELSDRLRRNACRGNYSLA